MNTLDEISKLIDNFVERDRAAARMYFNICDFDSLKQIAILEIQECEINKELDIPRQQWLDVDVDSLEKMISLIDDYVMYEEES